MDTGLCLVTGAAGAVGPVLIKEMLARGFQVRATTRQRPSPELLPCQVDVRVGDLCNREDVRQAVAGVRTVFHLAAKLHIPNPSAGLRAEYERVNVEGTRILVEEAQAAGVARLVFFSTVSVYGPTGASPVDEMAIPHPDTIYAETKLQAEQIVLSTTSPFSGQHPGVVLRMGAVYGPRMKGNYVSLLRGLAGGRFIPVGNGENLRTLVYDNDAAAAAVLAAQHPQAAGQIYNVSDGSVHTVREITEAICASLGRKPPRLSVPVPAARLVAAVVDAGLSSVGRRPRFSPAVTKLLESAAVSSDKIQRELGFTPEHDLKRGWRETVRALGLGPRSE